MGTVLQTVRRYELAIPDSMPWSKGPGHFFCENDRHIEVLDEQTTTYVANQRFLDLIETSVEPNGRQLAQKPKTPETLSAPGVFDVSNMAVKKGFEPLIQFPVYTLSRRAPSATRTLHRFSANLFGLSRRANVVESARDGKAFLQDFHALKQSLGFLRRRWRDWAVSHGALPSRRGWVTSAPQPHKE